MPGLLPPGTPPNQHQGGQTMPTTPYTVEQFLADTRETISSKGIPSGLEEIRRHLERLLHHPTLLQNYLGDPPPFPPRQTIAHDPQTDVHVLIHGRDKAGKSVPHDHGPCWVIYGNYTNYTLMRRWKRQDDGSLEGHAELALQKEFRLNAGQAAVFASGDIHSIEYPDGTYFIRVTGGDVEQQKTLRFDPDRQTVEVENRSQRRS
jgi:hypothetical protein